jgi:polynucleotide kinase-phosphatase
VSPHLEIPDPSLVLLVGASGSGKSTFAAKHFRPSEVISSDRCRALVADDENDQSATADAFEVLGLIVSKRLAAGRLVVVDATNVQAEARRPLLALAKAHDQLCVALVFDLPERLCQDRNRGRADRDLGAFVIRNQAHDLRRSLRGLEREGIKYVRVFRTSEEVDATTVSRVPLWTDRRGERGPFDVIGDVHGCFDELVELLERLGWVVARRGDGRFDARHPAGRRAIFLGDLVDRGPRSPDVLRLAMDMVASGAALCVPGNHDARLLKHLRGKNVRPTHGLAETIAQIDAEPPELRERVAEFLGGLVSHYVLEGGGLVVAHAGMKEEYQGRASGRVREFALYGDTTGETDEFGLPVRQDWAESYRGRAAVVYGHTPVPEAEWMNRTINVDTGCVFGGSLTALRWPEREIASVRARRTYCEPAKPFLREPDAPPVRRAQHVSDDVLDIADVAGKRFVETRLRGRVTIREENAAAALETMSRFAVDPKWLVYLPPTMSPCETSEEEGLLEHPSGAFDAFRRAGVARVVCQEKHMGSRAVIVVCRDAEAARRRFGVVGDAIGAAVTRTGRRFFAESAAAMERACLERLRDAIDRSGLFAELATDWLVLDAEILPWSAKAQALLEQQYAPVGSAGRRCLDAAVTSLASLAEREPGARQLFERQQARADRVARYVAAYRRYCWPVRSLDDLAIAPFHVLASEGAVHASREHAWHLDAIDRLCAADGKLLRATARRLVDVGDAASEAAAVAWWHELTDTGGEGMVVKPAEFVARGGKGLVQPAIKCRGREYLRIIYGPEYDLPENLARLRERGLARKRSLALREFALGIEALERFVRGEPLRRVHECVFAVLALESEPVDPRL